MLFKLHFRVRSDFCFLFAQFDSESYINYKSDGIISEVFLIHLFISSPVGCNIISIDKSIIVCQSQADFCCNLCVFYDLKLHWCRMP